MVMAVPCSKPTVGRTADANMGLYDRHRRIHNRNVCRSRDGRMSHLVRHAGEQRELARPGVSPNQAVRAGRRPAQEEVVRIKAHALNRRTRISDIRLQGDRRRVCEYVPSTGSSMVIEGGGMLKVSSMISTLALR